MAFNKRGWTEISECISQEWQVTVSGRELLMMDTL